FDTTAAGVRPQGFLLGRCGFLIANPLHTVIYDDLRQTPIHNERFTELAEHDVARLQIAMKHTAAVGVGDSITNVEKATQQPAEFQRIDPCRAESLCSGSLPVRSRTFSAPPVEPGNRMFEIVAAYEAHRVKRPTIGICPKAVDRHNPGMLEAAGNFCFEDKSASAIGIVGMAELNLLESDFAMKFHIFGDED